MYIGPSYNQNIIDFMKKIGIAKKQEIRKSSKLTVFATVSGYVQ